MSRFAEKSKLEDGGHYFKFYHDNWIAGVHGKMTLEQEGLYLRLVTAMWLQKGPIPSDPAWLGERLSVDVRTVKRLLPQLVAKQKIECEDGLLRNKKMMNEIAKYLRSQKPKSIYNTETSAELPGDFSETSPEDLGVYWKEEGKKPNEINGGSSPPKLELQSELELEPKTTKVEASQPASYVEDDAACGQAGGPSPEAVIFDQVRGWFGDDETRARLWVTTHVGLYGLPLVRDGVAVVVGEIASGKRVAQPAQLVASVIRRLDANRPAPNEAPPDADPPWIAERKRKYREAQETLERLARERAERDAAKELAA